MMSFRAGRWASVAAVVLLSTAPADAATARTAAAAGRVGYAGVVDRPLVAEGCSTGLLSPRAGLTPRVLTSFTVESWNMQGSSTSGECIWLTRVYPLARTSHVLALQEAGAPPASAQPVPGRTWTQNGRTVTEYLWRPGGSRGGDFYLYWMRTDTSPGGNGRVNLAMVVPAAQRARDVVIAWDTNPAHQSVRPALGILPTDIDQYVFTVHASAQASTGRGRAGWDAPRIVSAIECEMAARGRRQWIAAGDWNRLPDNWASQGGGTTLQVAPSEPTRPASGAVIDYAVINRTLTLPTRARTEHNRGGGQSDHLPVFLHFGS